MSVTREQLKKLQNGSDVRGVAVEGIEGQPVTLTEEAANRIAGGFARWLAAKCAKPTNRLAIAVGHDSRISAPGMKAQVLKAFTAAGVHAVDCGLASTPAMFMSVVFPETQYDGAVMITASHLPYNRNGLKFFDRDGGLEKADIAAILELACECEAADAPLDTVEQLDLIALYAKSLREKIAAGVHGGEKPLQGLHVVVDAGNGAGGFFVEQVLKPLGADTGGSQFLDPDGYFPNHIPNPEDKAAMESIRTAVLENHADLGIIFDTDVDRMSAVLPDGTEVNRDAIIALMAAILAPEYPGGTVVTDSVTSDKLTDFLENRLHMKHHRFKRGYKNVINECKRLNESGIASPLAIETSGHGALKENYYLDDGAYLAVKLLIAAAVAKRDGKEVGGLIAGLEKAYEAREYRMKIAGDEFGAYGADVLKAFEERAAQKGYAIAPDSYEGIRISFSGEIQGWALLRMSLHDPLMPLNLEGARAGDCERIMAAVKGLLDGFDRLDMSALG